MALHVQRRNLDSFPTANPWLRHFYQFVCAFTKDCDILNNVVATAEILP